MTTELIGQNHYLLLVDPYVAGSAVDFFDCQRQAVPGTSYPEPILRRQLRARECSGWIVAVDDVAGDVHEAVAFAMRAAVRAAELRERADPRCSGGSGRRPRLVARR
jgi:hypothetical protein